IEFLLSVFGDLAEARPLVVSFAGAPDKVSGASWSGTPWFKEPDQHLLLSDRNNNYFTLASYRPDVSGNYRRQKKQFHALHAVMLDDVGTKVERDRLTLDPSWLLETSPGNYQAGYLLTPSLKEPSVADRLMKAIINANLCDPGADGPQTRLARLPVGGNGKLDPSFPCRMEIWSPNVRYSIEELVNGLQLELQPPGKPKHYGGGYDQNHPSDDYSVFIPGPQENTVLAALRALALYKQPLGDGKHDIICPWVNEHTNKIDGGTAYFEPDGSWPIGGFKCLHGHCSSRHIRELLDYLGIEVGAASMKSTIRVMPGELNRVVDAAERELHQTGRFYQRAGLIVTIVTDPGTGETKIQQVGLQGLVRVLSGLALWERYDARVKAYVRIDPPARHTTILSESMVYNHLPVLNGLARQPYLRPDGSLVTVAGYDGVTGMFGVFDARSFSIPEEPSQQHAKEALVLLNELLDEFSFACDIDRAAALSAILTAAIRPSLPLAPMFHVRAPVVGSGKSYLCRLISAFAGPQLSAPASFPAHDEECRKVLLAELLRSPAVIEFDNLTSDLLAHKSLCSALTADHISGRILGVSKTVTVGTRTLFLSSGNNVGPVQDMTRRCLSIHLDSGCETPANRRFSRPDLVREVLAERGKYVSAALTIIRAWIVAGRRKADAVPLAGFGDWSDLCRQPLLWLSCSDPITSLLSAMNEDPDRELLGRLLVVWYRIFNNNPTMVRELVERVTPDGTELFEILNEIAGERGVINRRRLGRWIKRHADRIVDGRRFIRASGKRSAEAWQVVWDESVTSVSSVCVPNAEESVRPEKATPKKGKNSGRAGQLALPGMRL
ncbi:MAG: hypothetical protein IH612_09935, partial [Desulfofustis sp.]|nr:hypothetical protein [Desulfofustis sp.]